MYPDNIFSKPTDYYREKDGEVLPPYPEFDQNLDSQITKAAERQLGQLAVGPEGKSAKMSDEEYIRRFREEREEDRYGTHPGSSNEPNPEDVAAGVKARKKREKAIKQAEKLKRDIEKAKSVVERISPSTRDTSLARELGKARDFLRKNGLNPSDFVPDYWK